MSLCKQKLLKKCQSDKQLCEKTWEQATKKLMVARQDMNEMTKQFDECLEKSIKVANNQSSCARELKTANIDLNKYKSTIYRCEKTKQELIETVKLYREFESSTKENINIVKQKYEAKWQQFEKMWYKWNIGEISLFLKYKLTTSGMDEMKNEDKSSIDWDKFEEILRKEKFKSKYLAMVDKSELKSFGIDDYKLRSDIFVIIQNLCKNNPIPIRYAHGGKEHAMASQPVMNDDIKEKNDDIDSKYYCPLTKKVMINPVIAFDQQCYEKDAIISYFRKYKQSPITKEKIEDDVEWVIQLLVANTQLKEEIQNKALL